MLKWDSEHCVHSASIISQTFRAVTPPWPFHSSVVFGGSSELTNESFRVFIWQRSESPVKVLKLKDFHIPPFIFLPTPWGFGVPHVVWQTLFCVCFHVCSANAVINFPLPPPPICHFFSHFPFISAPPAGSSVISCVSCFFLSFGNSESAMIALLCLFGGISIASWNSLDVLTVELYPSDKR